MRTKTLLLTAALAAAGLATSMAQTVYSVNAVGYVNLTIPAGFSIVANPLLASNNNITNLFAAASEGTTIYRYVNGAYQTSAFEFGDWSKKDMVVNPGEAVFVKAPTGGSFTNTFVGEVMSGSLTNPLPAGFSLRGSQVPQAGLLETDLKFTPAEGDNVFQYDGATQKYLPTRAYEFGSWSTQPNLKVGEGFFLKNTGAARNWTRTFSIGT
jgi:hypothetical protein